MTSTPDSPEQESVQICVLPSETATAHLGELIARLLEPGDCILLDGALGAGKTALVRAILRELLCDATLDVPSPTFTLVQAYHMQHPRFGALTLSHFDLWRLSGPEGIEELGWDDAREGVVFVEWPERLEALRPARALTIHIELGGEPQARVVRLSGTPLPQVPTIWPR